MVVGESAGHIGMKNLGNLFEAGKLLWVERILPINSVIRSMDRVTICLVMSSKGYYILAKTNAAHIALNNNWLK